MNAKQLKAAAQLYEGWSAAQLVRATTVESQDYEPEALDLMARELSRRGVSAPERESVEKGVRREVEDERKRHTGIRGFLLFFVIGVVLGSLLSAFLGVAFLGERGLFPLCGVLSLILAGYGFYVFYVLIRKRHTAPQHAQRFLLSGFVLSILETLAVWSITGHVDAGPLSAGVGTAVWLGYFTWSRRVANTYGQPQDTARPQNEHSADTA